MEEEKFVLSILVTNEQKRVIEALFGHNNWDFTEVPVRTNEDVQMSASNQLQSANEIVTEPNGNDESVDNGDDGNAEENVQLASDEETDPDMCDDCLLSPCVTIHRQAWLGNGKRAHINNRNLRHIRYKKFWAMLENKNAWRKPRYLRKKATYMRREEVDETVIRMNREIMPECVTGLVRGLYPNPPGVPYIGHMW